MANRILRDWTQSENIDNLSDKAEIMFTRLIMKADDFGCYYGNAKLLKSHLFPLKELTNSEVENMITELHTQNLILLYINSDRRYLQIINFGQRLRSMVGKFPLPENSSLLNVGDPRTNDGENIKPSESEPPTIDSDPPLARAEVETEVEVETEDETETKKKVSEQKSSVHSFLKSEFLIFYKEKTTSEYIWGARDGKATNEIIKKLIFKIKEKNPAIKKESEDGQIIESFKHLLAGIRDDWILSNLSMSIINSKMNEIINQIINKKNGKQSVSDHNRQAFQNVRDKFKAQERERLDNLDSSS